MLTRPDLSPGRTFRATHGFRITQDYLSSRTIFGTLPAASHVICLA